MPKYVPTTQTPETLASLADELEMHAKLARAVSDGMKRNDFPQLTVMNGDQRKRGLAFIENFVNAARAAIREAREERQDFGMPAPKNGKKPVSGRSKKGPKAKDLRSLPVSESESEGAA